MTTPSDIPPESLDAAPEPTPGPQPIPLDPPVAACLALVAERGWAGFALRDVAQACGLGLAALYRRYPSRVSLLAAWLAAIDAALLKGADHTDTDETARDRLFDTMMRRYDLLVPWRAAIRRLRTDLPRDPGAALALAPAVDRAMAVVLEAAGVASDGWQGRVRRQGLALIHARVLGVWVDDESVDLAKTMAALDSRLKTAERRVRNLNRLCRALPRRRAAEAPQPEPAS
jgi:AcrR family transcriptional regulator